MSLERERLTNLFEYFKAVEHRRRPRIVSLKDQHWSLSLNDLPFHTDIALDPTRALNEDGAWLRIKKPKRTNPPAPPEEVVSWLHVGWDSPSIDEPHVKLSRSMEKNGVFSDVRFDSDQRRVSLFSRWLIQWRLWAKDEAVVRKVEAIWEQLFSIHADLTREGERLELMFGDGVLSYSEVGAQVFHPLVLRGVSRFYDPVEKEFWLSDKDGTPELYSAVFGSAVFASFDVKKWRKSLEDQDLHPLDESLLTNYLKGLIGSVAEGEYANSDPGIRNNTPIVFRSPTLFVRRKETGLAEFIDEILRDLPGTDHFPSSLLGVVGVNPPTSLARPSERMSHGNANEQEEYLLTKPANNEQLEILKRIANNTDVLVQGPPGTGKTHTIANLIGNFLAEGKSVLVTSHSTKALRVVREKVAEPLRALCVSLLDNDKESQIQRETAIRELSERMSGSAHHYREEARNLSVRRAQIIQTINKKRAELHEAVDGEYRPIVFNGEQHSPASVAKRVFEEQGEHDWLPGPLTPLVPCPLTIDEISFVYQASKNITSADEAELSSLLIDRGHFPNEVELGSWVGEEARLEADPEIRHRSELWKSSGIDCTALESLSRNLLKSCQMLRASDNEVWSRSIVEAGINGGERKAVWEMLCSQIEDLKKLASQGAESNFKWRPRLQSSSSIKAQLTTLLAIERYFEENRTISWIRLNLLSPSWAANIKAWRVKDETPKTLDEIRALRVKAELEVSRKELIDSWTYMCSSLGMAGLDGKSEPEEYASQFIQTIRHLLRWDEDVWSLTRSVLESEGLDWQRLLAEVPAVDAPEHQTIRRLYLVEKLLPAVLTAEQKRRRLKSVQARFSELKATLNGIQATRTKPSKLISRLIDSVQSRSTVEFNSACQALDMTLAKKSDSIKRGLLLKKLSAVAEKWSTALQDRDPTTIDRINATSFEPARAWFWTQMSQELDRRAGLSVSDILDSLRQLVADLELTTVSLVENNSWANLLDKVTSDQRRALMGWATTMKRIGAGTGKLVPQFRRQAKQEMNAARGAVPIWIMPFSSVTQSFHPVRDKFDVLIVDEASQEDVLGLSVFYLAKKVIVVGDDEQVTPMDVGSQQEPLQNLISQWISDLPSARLFDTKTSIYDRALISFGSVIRLREHFRCVPEIIQFSNALCYEYSIRPLREAASARVSPALVYHRISGTAEGKTNRAEADEIVSIVRACIELPEYEGLTFGVISMVGDDQARLIDAELRKSIDPSVYEARRFLCGSPSQFQGDERDVVLLSLVDSETDESGPLTLRQDGADGMWKKRFNVATSRARDQLWVVSSLDHTTKLKPGDIRRRLIEHAINPEVLMDQLIANTAKTESPFEAEVLKILTAGGYRVTPQWKVGAYRIDMVVEGGGRRLAIECDGDRFHYDKVEEDLARQALLERLGWTFARIRGSEFYRDKTVDRTQAMQPVYKKLEQLGIYPFTEESNAGLRTESTELIARVKARASEIRIEQQMHRNATEQKGRLWTRQPVEPQRSAPASVKSAEGQTNVNTSLTGVDMRYPANSGQFSLFSVNVGGDAGKTSTQETKGNERQKDRLSKGRKVSHPKFGDGTIVDLCQDRSVSVLFGKPWGLKNLHLDVAKLRLID
jgi:very-short-patch-repair endonuclease